MPISSDVKDYCKLYLVLESALLKYPLEQFLDMAISGGVTAIQLRDKNSTAHEKYEIGKKIANFLKNRDVMFIVNDRCDLALVLGADGVHLGVKDIPLDITRKMVDNKIIGYSCNTVDDCILANKYADYVGVGPVHHTDTKQDLRQVINIDGLGSLATNLSIPSVAIGGISINTAKDVLDTGITGLAVSSYLCSSENVYDDALSLRRLIL